MRTPNLSRAGICGTASLLAATITHAAPPPTTVTVENTPLPVQVTNATPLPVTGSVALSGGSVSATLSGTPTVSATVTNTATNPVAVTNSDRPTAFHQTVALTTAVSGVGSSVPFTIPTGCRLVVQAVSFFALETPPAPLHAAGILLTAGASHFIPTQQVTIAANGLVRTFGTLAIELFVDTTQGLQANDNIFPTTTEFFSVSGYLLPLTTGASC